MPTQIKLSSNARAVVTQVRRMRVQMLAGLRAGLDEENHKTIVALTLGRMGYSKAGPVMPDGLRRISSTGVRSLRATPAVNVGDGVTSSLGSNLRYIIAHEFGFAGVVTVRAHERRLFKYGKARLVRFTNPVTGEAGESIRRRRRVVKNADRTDKTATVRAHEMRMNLPARHMIRDTLAERIPNYAATLSAAIVTTYNELLAVAAKATVEPITRTP